MFIALFLLLFTAQYSVANNGLYLQNGPCPSFSCVDNFDLNRLLTVWTVTARTNNLFIALDDCTRILFMMSGKDALEIYFIIRPMGSNLIRGLQANLEIVDFGLFNLVENLFGQISIFLSGSLSILETDNETYAIVVMCKSILSTSYIDIFVLVRGIPPTDLRIRVEESLRINGLNPIGIIWDTNLRYGRVDAFSVKCPKYMKENKFGIDLLCSQNIESSHFFLSDIQFNKDG